MKPIIFTCLSGAKGRWEWRVVLPKARCGLVSHYTYSTKRAATRAATKALRKLWPDYTGT